MFKNTVFVLFFCIIMISLYVTVTAAACDCYWTEEEDPVCGSDGETYGNPGKLACHNKCDKPAKPVEIVHKGPCC